MELKPGFTLFFVVVASLALSPRGAQALEYSRSYDGNGDGRIDANDLMGILSRWHTMDSGIPAEATPESIPSATGTDNQGATLHNRLSLLWVTYSDGQTPSGCEPEQGTASINNHNAGGFSIWAEMAENLGFKNSQVLEPQFRISAETMKNYGTAIFAFNWRPFTADEADAFKQWVYDGGRAFFVAGLAIGNGDKDRDNELLAPFGISYGDSTIGRIQQLSDFSDHPIARGVRVVQTDIGNFINAPPDARILAKYDNRPALVSLKYGKGEVLVFYDCNCFMNGPFDGAAMPSLDREDNFLFAGNVLLYLRDGNKDED